MALTKAELAETLEELESIKGSNTELITVFISAGYDINSVQRQLEAEKATAKNIKSTATRKNVMEALEKIVRNLKEFGQTPSNGLAVFCGDVSQGGGESDVQIWAFEPPEELNMRLYRCDKEFVLDPLKEMLEVDEVFGLIVMDRKEATIGLLKGKKIDTLQHITSGVPGKFKAGGQCLSPDTLVMKKNGEIVEIDTLKSKKNVIQAVDLDSQKNIKTQVNSKWDNKKEVFRVTTCYPRFEIEASNDHTFFVKTEEGIEEKKLSEIKKGEYLVMPEEINTSLEDQNISFTPEIKREVGLKDIKIPKKITKNFAKVLGYYLGDGGYEQDRISFFEQRKDVIEYYKGLIAKLFGIEPKLRFGENKNYYQLRVYSRIISQLFRKIFGNSEKTLKEKIPSIILKSSNECLASFLAGFFDAEGYISSGRVGLGINNKTLAKQIQFALLRLGIISSLATYNNRRNPHSNNTKYIITIEDTESLRKFNKKMGFSSYDKNKKVEGLVSSRGNKNKVIQLVVNGKDIAKLLRSYGYNTTQFLTPLFFVNKRQLNKILFKEKIIDKIKNNELREKLEAIYNSSLIGVKISQISKIGKKRTVDIETSSNNFLANGILVHNSSQRFERMIEGMTKDFYKRVAEEAKSSFIGMDKLKGIIVGGPIPTKDEFLDGEYLDTRLKKLVIGRKDVGDTDESGLEELVGKSQDLLEQQEIIHENQVLDRFFETLGEKPHLAAYKEDNIRKALEYGAVETLFLSDSMDKKTFRELEKKAKEISANVETISTDTEKGQQFKNLSGFGAILRFGLGEENKSNK